MPRTGRPVTTPESDNPVSELRRARGWSQATTAKELGICRSAVSMYETGANTVPESVAKLAALLMKKAPG